MFEEFREENIGVIKLEKKTKFRHKEADTERVFRDNQLANIKQRCNKLGLEYNLSVDKLAWPDVCPILGIKLRRGREGFKDGCSPSIDRLNPNRGYTLDNVRVISRLANTMKSNATPEQLEMFAKNIGSYLRGEL